MKQSDVLVMIEQDLSDFEDDRENEKNIRMLLNFNSSTSMDYIESEFKILQPKFKKKLSAHKYIKNTGNNQLF